MRPRLSGLFILVLLGVGATAVLGFTAHARPALNIGLVRFEAFPMDNRVRLEWDVETEVGTAGYKIKRGQNGSFAYITDPAGNGDLFVIAEGGPAQGHNYTAFDDTAVNGATYTYQLFEITTGNTEQLQDETTVTVHVEPTATPITFTGGTGNNTPGDSTGNNATPTATLAPTVTSQPAQAATNAPQPALSAPTPLPSPTSPVAADTATQTGNPDPPAAADSAAAAYPPGVALAQAEDGLAADDPAALAVVQAPEETSAAYPAPLAGEPEAGTQPGGEGVVLGDGDGQPATQNGIVTPIVIGGSGRAPAGGSQSGSQNAQIGDEVPLVSGSSLLLLWTAFVVALGIFIASLIGAIILYTRRPQAK